ncbi:DUF4304 domain-containing protein [Chryseobacterium indologenes]|uniref:DUF4304 domain-containing protein n=1 Tax=Chryseobacterium indologenes TaxID=253 RepID=UPI000F4F0F46|nr:DUF4304 domain-containing protein [Chryseobacterium indologenes]AYZ36190.1 DUF4304 domain-containing protein [Chryseobacterium indologenes]MEB4760820.1 DUF4304 domain-containing protein [Chryseobacterium indologenes]
MKNKILESILSELLIPNGFKKKGNYWLINGNELTKIVHLQKSQFGNSFYINFGYIINSIPLNGLSMHIFQQVSSLDEKERNRIMELLNLDNDISETVRIDELDHILRSKLVDKMKSINSQDDIRKMTEDFSQAQLNMIPLSVKEYLKITT